MKYNWLLCFGLFFPFILIGCNRIDIGFRDEVSQENQSVDSAMYIPTPEGMESETEYIGEGQPEAIKQDISQSSTYQVKDTIVVGFEQKALYELTIDEIAYTDRRDEYVQDPGNVILVTYTYKNLSDESILLDDMSFQMMRSDEETLLESYYLADALVPEPIEKNATCTAQIVYSIPDKVDSVVLVYHDIVNIEIMPIKIVADDLN